MATPCLPCPRSASVSCSFSTSGWPTGTETHPAASLPGEGRGEERRWEESLEQILIATLLATGMVNSDLIPRPPMPRIYVAAVEKSSFFPTAVKGVGGMGMRSEYQSFSTVGIIGGNRSLRHDHSIRYVEVQSGSSSGMQN